MKILVIGNCQAFPTKKSLEMLNSSISAHSMWPHDFQRMFSSRDEALSFVASFDAVPSQYFLPTDGSLHLTTELIEQASKFSLRYPNVQFPAFHPDCVYAADLRPNGGGISSAVGDYSSAILLFGFSQRFSADQTLKMFSENVFSLLGYDRIWEPSQESLRKEFASTSFSFDKHFFKWCRKGCFMHTINHPCLVVSADLSVDVVEKLGMQARSIDVGQYMADPGLLGPVWPVYPSIASNLQLVGGYNFKKAGDAIHMSIDEIALDLSEFVKQTYHLLAEYDPEFVGCSRIAEWNENASLVEELKSYAFA